MRVNQDMAGRVADVGVFGNYAYLAAFNARDCQKGGVYVFDVSNPAAPKQINFIRAANNTHVGEGVQVLPLRTAAFTGDLLLHNNEICGPANTGAKGGISLVDVTNPKVHKSLAEGVGDLTPAGGFSPTIAHMVHSVFAWQAGPKAYAVLVDDEEGADVDIMEITDPRHPRLIAEYNLGTRFPQILQPDLGPSASSFHDVIVKPINGRFIMLLSYWDGGYVTLDMTYIADSDFANPDPQALKSGVRVRPEGNAHEAEFSRNNDCIVAADEDFVALSIAGRNTTDGTPFQVSHLAGTPPLDASRTVTGQTVFVGFACTARQLPSINAPTPATRTHQRDHLVARIRRMVPCRQARRAGQRWRPGRTRGAG